MGVIAHNEEDVKLLARLMRAEAEGEGQQGMLMVDRNLFRNTDFVDVPFKNPSLFSFLNIC